MRGHRTNEIKQLQFAYSPYQLRRDGQKIVLDKFLYSDNARNLRKELVNIIPPKKIRTWRSSYTLKNEYFCISHQNKKLEGSLKKNNTKHYLRSIRIKKKKKEQLVRLLNLKPVYLT